MRGDRRVQVGPSQARARSWEPTPKRPTARTVLARSLLSTPGDGSPLGQTPGKNGHGGRPLGRTDSIRLFTPRCMHLCQTSSLPGRPSSCARRLRRCLPEQVGCPRAVLARVLSITRHLCPGLQPTRWALAPHTRRPDNTPTLLDRKLTARREGPEPQT